jgi:hypothetical protein
MKKTLNVILNNKNIKNENLELILTGFLMEIISKK